MEHGASVWQNEVHQQPSNAPVGPVRECGELRRDLPRLPHDARVGRVLQNATRQRDPERDGYVPAAFAWQHIRVERNAMDSVTPIEFVGLVRDLFPLVGI